MIQRVDCDIQRRVVPLHLLTFFHVHLHGAPLGGADASHAEYDEEHEESDADHRDHCNPGP